jgi:hypothetical protein
MNKTRKNKKNSKGGAGDIFLLKSKKICGDTFNLYFNEVFASGNNYVYSLCKDNELKNCNKTLAKIYKNYSEQQKIDIEEETKYMKTAFELGVSPEFVGIQYCEYDGKKYAILIIKNYGSGNLTKLLKNNYYAENKEVIDIKLKQLLDTLYDNNINQNDLHSDNFLYIMNDAGDIEFKIIDFDNAIPLNAKKRVYTIENLNNGSYIDIGRGYSKRNLEKSRKSRKSRKYRK